MLLGVETSQAATRNDFGLLSRLMSQRDHVCDCKLNHCQTMMSYARMSRISCLRSMWLTIVMAPVCSLLLLGLNLNSLRTLLHGSCESSVALMIDAVRLNGDAAGGVNIAGQNSSLQLACSASVCGS